MANIIWTKHALERIKDRKLPQKLVDETITSPDKNFDSRKGLEFQKKFQSQIVTAVVKRNENGELIVISAWVDPPNPGTKDYKQKKRYKEMQKAGVLKRFWLSFLSQLDL